MQPFAQSIYKMKYSMNGEEWPDTARRVTQAVTECLPIYDNRIEHYIAERKFIPGGRYLYAAGRPLHMVCNCLCLRAEDSREGWSELMYKAGMALMTGAGIGIEYSAVRESGAPISRTGGRASGPISLMEIINEIGRHVIQGGSRRSAVWSGLSWSHPDIFNFITLKNWSEEVRALKAKDFAFPATMDMTNVSVSLDDDFFLAYEDEEHPKHLWARDVYQLAVRRMTKTGEPGFSVNIGDHAGENLANACTEVRSRDDSDICNLGSINLSRVESLSELDDIVDAATLFLLAGTVYTDVPYAKVLEVKDKNRRLGLGLMGLHDWLLQRGKRYGPDPELASWLDVYASSTAKAHYYADRFGLNRPVATRAIAPTGTISIIGETTSGLEPIFCAAYKRRYLQDNQWSYQYVVDPTAKRLIESGIDPTTIEDAYSIDPERRIAFQAWVQQWVDQGISSTINLPAPLEPTESVRFGEMLYPYLKKVRGLTLYPNGARDGQPLTQVDILLALDQEGAVYEEAEDRCVGGVCGV